MLISVRAPVGPTNLAPSECCIGRGLAAIRPRNGIPPKYILHYLRSIESDIDSLGTGTTFKAISGKTLREIPIPVAPPAQQKRIVAEIEKQFSRLDEAVANLKRVKANLKRYKAAVLKAAVEGRLVETEAERARSEGRSYETGTQLLQRILETRRSQWQGKGKYKEPAPPDTTGLPDLPEGWVWASVEQLTWLITSGSRGWGDYYSDIGVLFIRAQDIKTDVLNNRGVARVGERWFRPLYLATLALCGCPEVQIKKAELALGPMRFDTATDRSVQGALRVARQDLEAWVYSVPNVMDLDALAVSCRLNERPTTVYGKWVWPEKAMLEAVARI